MKRLLILFFVFLLLCSVSLGANDFSGDGNCVALWRFEDGALTADSIGGNTLTNNNGVTADAVNYREGAAAGDFEMNSSQYMSIADADLDAGFPLKNGDANKKISVCCWFRPESHGSGRYLFTKYNTNTGERSLLIEVYGTDIRVYIGYNGGAGAEALTILNLNTVATQWYHIGFTFQDSDKSYRIRCWDETGSSVVEVTGNSTNNINVESAAVAIGAVANPAGYFDGIIDRMVVFNDILTAGEIDQIYEGTYGAAEHRGQVIIIDEN